MKKIAWKRDINKIKKYTDFLIKWLLGATLIGIAVGGMSALMYFLVLTVTQIRESIWFFIFIIPGAAALTAYMFKKLARDKKSGMSRVLSAIRSGKTLYGINIPLMGFATLLSHICGASVGVIDAAMEMGATLSVNIGKILKANNNDKRILAMCGVSAAFSAIMGTPIAATVFAMEVANVGYMYYAAIIPCAISSIAGYLISYYCGIPFVIPKNMLPSGMWAVAILGTISFGIVCALLGRILNTSVDGLKSFCKNKIQSSMTRSIAGGFLIFGLSFLVGKEYMGLGVDAISNAFEGYARPESFIIKAVLAAVAITAGFKGGGIVPSLFIGATFGSYFAYFFGLSGPIAAALAMISLFCCVTNCPVAAIIMSLELFGSANAPLFLIMVAIAYALSGYGGLYRGQKVLFSKTKVYLFGEEQDESKFITDISAITESENRSHGHSHRHSKKHENDAPV